MIPIKNPKNAKLGGSSYLAMKCREQRTQCHGSAPQIRGRQKVKY